MDITLPELSKDNLGNKDKQVNRVLFTIFAGRKRYLSILKL